MDVPLIGRRIDDLKAGTIGGHYTGAPPKESQAASPCGDEPFLLGGHAWGLPSQLRYGPSDQTRRSGSLPGVTLFINPRPPSRLSDVRPVMQAAFRPFLHKCDTIIRTLPLATSDNLILNCVLLSKI